MERLAGFASRDYRSCDLFPFESVELCNTLRKGRRPLRAQLGYDQWHG